MAANWGAHYKWNTRDMKTMNSWISQLRHDSLSVMWENSVSIARSAPMEDFLSCTLDNKLTALVSTATKTKPVPTLGKSKVLPGQTSELDLGEMVIKTDATTNTGSDAVTIVVKSNAPDNLMDGNATGRRLDGRKLADINLNKALEASCYAVIKVDSKAVGQLIGDCLVFEPSAALSGHAEVCVTINSQIPVNSIFTTYGFALEVNGKFTVQTGTPPNKDVSGRKLCGKFQAKASYCPIMFNPKYTPGQALPSDFVAADSSCGTLAAITQTVKKQAKVLVDSGFVSKALVQVGQTTPPPSTDAISQSGAQLSSAGVVTDVKTFVEKATKAPTYTTTTTTQTTMPPKDKPTDGGDKPTDGGTQAGTPVYYGGSVEIKAPGATRGQMETAMQKTLALAFGVSSTPEAVTVSAAESRRLADAAARKLGSGNWSVSYTATIPAVYADAAADIVKVFKKDTTLLASSLGKELKAAGAAQGVIDGLAVSSFSADKVAAPKPKTTNGPAVKDPADVETTSLSDRAAVSMTLITLIAAISY